MISNEEIEAIAIEIAKDKSTESKKLEIYGAKYPQFKEDYPRLFDMCCEPGGINMTQLRYMMSMWTKVQNNTLTQEGASVQVGQVFFDKYVKPVVPKMETKK
jgi:hypothetical protein